MHIYDSGGHGISFWNKGKYQVFPANLLHIRSPDPACVRHIARSGILGEGLRQWFPVLLPLRAPGKVNELEKAYFEWAKSSDVLYFPYVWNTYNKGRRKNLNEYQVENF